MILTHTQISQTFVIMLSSILQQMSMSLEAFSTVFVAVLKNIPILNAALDLVKKLTLIYIHTCVSGTSFTAFPIKAFIIATHPDHTSDLWLITAFP